MTGSFLSPFRLLVLFFIREYPTFGVPPHLHVALRLNLLGSSRKAPRNDWWLAPESQSHFPGHRDQRAANAERQEHPPDGVFGL